MEDKINSMSLEKKCLGKIISILEGLPNRGENIDLNYVSEKCKKIEVSTSAV